MFRAPLGVIPWIDQIHFVPVSVRDGASSFAPGANSFFSARGCNDRLFPTGAPPSKCILKAVLRSFVLARLLCAHAYGMDLMNIPRTRGASVSRSLRRMLDEKTGAVPFAFDPFTVLGHTPGKELAGLSIRGQHRCQACQLI